ncbi:MAG: alkaline phytoceramidase, partial [Candidatus Acidiferrum sp.]
NVVSNLPFLLVGLWGIAVALRKNAFIQPVERWPYVVLFFALILTGFGSGYYHLHPDNARLVWDRLPITLVVMSLTAAVIAERIRERAGLILLPLLLLLGAASVWQWQHSEAMGVGDLRFYLYVQFFPMIGVALMMALFPARYTRSSYIFGLIGLYVVAKICELFDRPIYAALNGSLSGHTLKHLIAAAATGCIALMLVRRSPVQAMVRP